MDRVLQLEAGHRLDTALRRAGVVIERGVYERGNLRTWQRVGGASLIGRLMAVSGWRIRLDVDDEPAPRASAKTLPFELVDGGQP